MQLEIRDGDITGSLEFFVYCFGFLRIVSAILGVLFFQVRHVKLSIIISVFVKNCDRNLVGIALSL